MRGFFRRHRRGAFWTCVVLSVLVLAVHVASRWCLAYVMHRAPALGPGLGAVDDTLAFIGYGTIGIRCEQRTVSRVIPRFGWSAFLWTTRPRTLAGPTGSVASAQISPMLRWWGWRLVFAGSTKGVSAPIWVFALPFAANAVWLFRHRHKPPGHCPACGYDLAGIDGPCPECGSRLR